MKTTVIQEYQKMMTNVQSTNMSQLDVSHAKLRCHFINMSIHIYNPIFV